MDKQEQALPEATTVSESEATTTGENHGSAGNPVDDEKPSATPERKTPAESTTPSEQQPARRLIMPQDVRYATEQGDRDKLLEKYELYEVSDTNACNIRFVIDHRQKKNLLGRSEEEETNLHSLGKSFSVSILPAYQNPPKHSFKVFGTESNVRKCITEVLNRIYTPATRSTTGRKDNESHHEQTTKTNTEKSEETDRSTTEQTSPPSATSVFVTTINADSSITEEKKPITPSTPNLNEEKNGPTNGSNEQEAEKFVPVERKPEYTFTILITSQGQEVLKKNWSFFAGPLQQRLNVTVVNPFKLPKFGDNQWQNELTITGESLESLTDAALQLTAFINDVLGVAVQPYKTDEEHAANDSNNSSRSKMNHNNDYHQQRRNEYNNSHRQSPSQPNQGQSFSPNNYHERTVYNRGRNNGAYEQVILIRGNCVARIVGTRGSNLRRIQSKCHLRDMIVARHSSDNGYVECTLSAYQTRNLSFAIDTIRASLRNEDDQAIQVLEAHYVDVPVQSSPYQHSPQNDQPQLPAPNQSFNNFQPPHLFTNHRSQPMSFTGPSDVHQPRREPGLMTRPLHFDNGTQLPPPSYNFRNTPSFDFTHQPTSAARKTDKRPGEVTDFTSNNAGQMRTSSDCQSQHTGGSSSSNSSSVSPRHKSKRTCPETKEIDCTTDAGFWIQKQYYQALDDASKELFDSLLEKLEKIRIANEENAARKQQRLVGRNRSSKSRAFLTSTTHTNGDKDSTNAKIEESTNSDEPKEDKVPPPNGSMAVAGNTSKTNSD